MVVHYFFKLSWISIGHSMLIGRPGNKFYNPLFFPPKFASNEISPRQPNFDRRTEPGDNAALYRASEGSSVFSVQPPITVRPFLRLARWAVRILSTHSPNSDLLSTSTPDLTRRSPPLWSAFCWNLGSSFSSVWCRRSPLLPLDSRAGERAYSAYPLTASQVISSLLLLRFSSDLRGIEVLCMLRSDLAISSDLLNLCLWCFEVWT